MQPYTIPTHHDHNHDIALAFNELNSAFVQFELSNKTLLDMKTATNNLSFEINSRNRFFFSLLALLIAANFWLLSLARKFVIEINYGVYLMHCMQFHWQQFTNVSSLFFRIKNVKLEMKNG